MHALITYLNTIHPLSEELKYHLLNTVKTMSVPKKGYILEAGHICPYVYFIQSGMVRHYRIERGAEITFRIIEKNGIVYNSESFSTKSFSSEFIQAIQPTELCYISFNELLYTFSRFSDFQYMYWNIVKHYDMLREQREQVLRMKLAKDRFKCVLEISPDFERDVPNNMLASYIGCTAVRLCSIKKQRY